ncbi:Thiamine kinase [Phocoenobacter uteri]|uniref:Thiamine kinase n=1 Tax=Phocoenobacter uteri TaxID=146806 RepID=A0A379C876_9PAST|nr:phosphotransferase [Phocoenobacter uteri]MDG6882255.1 hypothetical protein [Phocoenobacter uteri]SUB58411.1 Thiamine kinase [Phocoenobacter uteri]
MIQKIEHHFGQAVKFVTDFANQTACSSIIELENGERYVVHQQSERAKRLGINYQLELQILTKISPLGFMPKVVFHNEDYLILSYIQGSPPQRYNAILLKKLAEMIAKLHLFDAQEAIIFISEFAKIDPKLDIIERCYFLNQQLGDSNQFSVELSLLKPIQPFTQCICHHDLHLGNVIQNEDRVFLIDWEYAAISDPALEIALFFKHNDLTDEQKRFFLSHYFRLT